MIAENQIIKRIAYNIAREAAHLLGRGNRALLYGVMREAAYVEASVTDEHADILRCLEAISQDKTANLDAISKLAGEQFAARIRKLLESA